MAKLRIDNQTQKQILCLSVNIRSLTEKIFCFTNVLSQTKNPILVRMRSFVY